MHRKQRKKAPSVPPAAVENVSRAATEEALSGKASGATTRDGSPPTGRGKGRGTAKRKCRMDSFLVHGVVLASGGKSVLHRDDSSRDAGKVDGSRYGTFIVCGLPQGERLGRLARGSDARENDDRDAPPT